MTLWSPCNTIILSLIWPEQWKFFLKWLKILLRSQPKRSRFSTDVNVFRLFLGVNLIWIFTLLNIDCLRVVAEGWLYQTGGQDYRVLIDVVWLAIIYCREAHGELVLSISNCFSWLYFCLHLWFCPYKFAWISNFTIAFRKAVFPSNSC